MTIFSVRHITSYRYKRPVEFGEHRLMFRPRDSFDQTLLSSHLDVDPKPDYIRWIHDVFGNCVALVGFTGKARELCFGTNIRLDHTQQVEMDLQIDAEALHYPFAYDPEEVVDLERTIKRHFADPDDEVGRWTRQFVRIGQPTETGRLLMTLCYAIHESFIYARRLEHGTQTPLETLRLRRGTCRDFALLMMEAARSLGLAARFVTGYIYVPDRDGSTKLGGGSTHAWCQVYLPGAGWVEFDPTNGIVGNRDLIRVGVARDPKQAVPLSGSYDGDASDFDTMSVQVNVTTDELSDTAA
ncbi:MULTISPECIES: transglutaminase family protein [Rhizobium/Agrobacterium group]|uniref:Transglutaminase family protein n=1 Tax=Agrobacterium vitis TaxID=373 RepID=A0AAE2R960_AGRVI|nr:MULTISPECIES: transglutaminase family protein [Rhizobium/Agrobacterium group]MBF2713938.1 transglutaminase family protein [Agrobacterium vitis]MCF1445443.1 transglutaminase family protein [Allorhizobium ampelinum]MCF1472390.1 transglutaminase family protein [Allorhizobium ampelinum]MCF1495445.1 transglutaminase family protein [Allorhizobium ampelinum]MUZ62082.1 transglutaminase family protein [Agrobacterium vitis]